MAKELDRTVAALELPEWGRVVSTGEAVWAWTVAGTDGRRIEPVDRYLRDFAASGNSPSSGRSYAGALLRWWRFLHAVQVPWDGATPAEGRDFVLWMRQATKPVAARRTLTAATAGRVNPVTRKQAPSDRYAIRTIRHNNAVVRAFYEFFAETSEGPVLNPMPRERSGAGRAHAHHNPMSSFGLEGALRYNPKAPQDQRRALSEAQWADWFAVMRSDRDRALLALAVSCAARAGELLGLRVSDVDWGEQTVRVRRKGSGALQWLPASAEAFTWLRLWFNELGNDLSGDDPVWQTLRRRSEGSRAPRRRALTYDALRAVLRRANATLGTNWTLHDLRHTCALRLLRGHGVTVRDVQTILGHSHLSTTQIYLNEDDSEVIARVHRYLAERRDATAAPPPVTAAGYDPADLAVLLGQDSSGRGPLR